MNLETRFDVYEHNAPNRCLYINVAKLRTGVGSADTSYLQQELSHDSIAHLNCALPITKTISVIR